MGLKLPASRSAVAGGVAVVAAVGAIGGGMALAASPHMAQITVGVKKTSLGSVLYAGPKKLTVYMYSKDHGTKSACTSACLSVWPPVKALGTPKAGPGVNASALSTAKEGKFTQVTYKGHLLYYFAEDKNASSVKGQLLNAKGSTGGTPVWFALSARGTKVTKKPSTGTSTTGKGGGGGGGGWA